MSTETYRKRAAKNLLRRIGPSIMPIETTMVGSSVVQAWVPETGTSATFAISDRGRLTCTSFREKR